jgi:hypothetical protein
MKSSSTFEKEMKKFFDMIFDVPLESTHPKYKLQKQFNDFAKDYPELEFETNDFYNNGCYAGIHFKNDEFIVLCDMDDMTIETSILTDYENCLFDVVETIPFSWESLKSRLNDLVAIAPWTQTFMDSETEQEARTKTIKYLKDKWN